MKNIFAFLILLFSAPLTVLAVATMQAPPINVAGAKLKGDVYVTDCGSTDITVTVTTGGSVFYKGHVRPTKKFVIEDTGSPGTYTINFSVVLQAGTIEDYSFKMEKTLETLVGVKWNNVIVISNNINNNGGYTFISYQWYKEDRLMPGEVGQYYSAGPQETDLLEHVEYYAEVVTSTGKKMRICAVIP